MHPTFTLLIEGTALAQEITAGWETEVFVLDGAVRGTDTPLPRLELAGDAVLELELVNGLRLLVAAGDAERYLGGPAGRGEGAAAEITVGQSLRLTGPRMPAGLAREGIGAWMLKGVRIHRHGPAGMTALAAAGSFQDARLEHRNGLYRISVDRWELSPAERLALSAEPVLLLLHGTGSSAQGSFGDLWEDHRSLEALRQLYDSRIYAFEHRSLTESPIANALALVRAMPIKEPVRLHLLSHSRGGMVGELLARANRIDQEPCTEAEIGRFLELARRTGRQGFEAEAELLRQLNAELRKRDLRVERFVRVACPARGTTLVSGKLDRWASVLLNLLGKGLDAAGKGLPPLAPLAQGFDLLQNFLFAVVRERTDARILPGLEAMMPDSPLVALLNNPEVRLDPPLYVLAGDFRGDSLLSWLGDCMSEIFYDGETDLVVNTPSMSGGALRVRGIRQKLLSGPEVHHLSYFRRDESATALFSALRDDDRPFTLLAGPSRIEIDRGGKEIKFKDKAPICFLLPGIMGSHISIGTNRIWFDPFSLCLGGMDRLRINGRNIKPDGWLDRSYEALARSLAETHEVRPFAYDWRLSVTDAAQLFGRELDLGLKEAKARGQAVRIVAHSMGGLVARLALKGRWPAFKGLPGSRLLQLGTPNLGSHAMATVLLARDDFTQTIERWLDWKHDMRHFLEIVCDFPGVLELLPWPGETGLAADGVDYFSQSTWQDWYNRDQDPRKGVSWVVPRQEALDAARLAIGEMAGAGLDPECTLYVAGRAPTPMAVRMDNGRVEIGWSDEGDGRVAWKGGIPAGVPVWYVEAAHGDLANCEGAFAAYQELIQTGATRLLPRSPAISRGETAPVFRARSLSGQGLYPSAEEVLAAATGGSRPLRRRPGRGEEPAVIEIVHSSLAEADSPLLIGAYADEGLRGSARFLDSHLEGRLERALAIGRYPSQPGDALVFRSTESGARPAGAIVVGLGPLGELLPGTLTQAVTQGLLEYARIMEQRSAAEPMRPERLSVSALLVGTGFGGLAVEAGMRCLLDSLRRANHILQLSSLKTRIGRLTLFEEVEGRAVTAAQALRDLINEPRFGGVASFDGRLHDGRGGYCGRALAMGGQSGLFRVHIEIDQAGALRFTVVTDRARNVVSAEPDQRQAVDGMIRCATATTRDQPGLSRALFELLVPNSMKEVVADLRTLILSVDKTAAAYPWEMMRETDQPGEPPLGARIEMVRQLASTRGRAMVRLVEDKRALIVGDTRSDLAELPGAQAEAALVAECFTRIGYEVVHLCRATPLEVFDALFNGRYRFMHLAGHGMVNDPRTGCTGMVLGPSTLLTAAQVGKLRRVPEMVFLNCCHLGSMTGEAEQRWGELAVNLATAFIEMGCRAVIAAGWAVDDQAASTFARNLYAALFAGRRFAQALVQARFDTHRLHPATNTWGAFQAYGDERYRFPDMDAEDLDIREYVHPSHLVADLGMLGARILAATEKEKKTYYRKKLGAIERVARGTDFQHAGVRERLAAAWAGAGEPARAISHYRAALTFEDAGLSLAGLEKLAGLEIGHGADLLTAGEETGDTAAARRREGQELLQAGRQRLEQLLAIAPTSARLTLLGTYWQERTMAAARLADPDQGRQGRAQMALAFRQAAELAHRRTGLWPGQALIQALDATLLRTLLGEADAADEAALLLARLRTATGASCRKPDPCPFPQALAQVETERLDALWACLDGREQAALTRPEIRDRLISRYGTLLRDRASPCHQQLALAQPRFLLALLAGTDQAGEIREALQQIEQALAAMHCSRE